MQFTNPKNPMLKVSLASLIAVSSLVLVSCQDEDFGFETQEIRNSVYLRNFEKTYGKIAEDQTWDFSSYNLSRLGLAGGPSATGTRAGGSNDLIYTGKVEGTTSANASDIVLSSWPEGVDKSNYNAYQDYYKVDENTIKWLNENLKERDENNINKGKPFTLAKPNQGFAIIPIYQGHSGLSWDLHLVDKGNNKDYVIWSKSKNFAYTDQYYDGVEIFYNTSAHVSDGGDVVKWSDGGKPGAIKIAASFSHYNPSDTDASRNYVGVKFKLPTGKKVSGYFADSSDNNKVETFSIDNSNGNNANKEIWIKAYNGQWNDLTLYITEGNEYFNSFDEENKIRIYAHYNYWEDKSIQGDLSNLTGHTVDRLNVHTKPILIDPTKIQGDFLLYLKITQEDKWLQEKNGTCQRSDEGMMIALPLDKPAGIGDQYEHMIIGCEDLKIGSDWDANDIVFLLIGQKELPKVKETISKRYMIEDLGSTFDFDFNDIVLDVEQNLYKDYAGNTTKIEQKAYLRHLSGTIPFKITVGNTPLGTKEKYEGRNLSVSPWRGDDPQGNGFDPATDGYYYDLIGQEVTGWNPDNNNIKVTSWPSLAGWDHNKTQANTTDIIETGTTYQFPPSGKYPYIIACDVTTPWTKEMVNVPNSWFNTWKVPTPNPGIGGGSGTGGGTTGGNTPSIDTSTFGTKYTYNASSDKVTNSNVGTDFEVVDLTRALQNYAGGRIEVRIVNKTTTQIGAQIKLRNNDYSQNRSEDRIVVSNSTPGVFELTDQAYTSVLRDNNGKLVMFIDKSSYQAFQQSEVYIKYEKVVKTISYDFSGSNTGTDMPQGIYVDASSKQIVEYNGNKFLKIQSKSDAQNDYASQLQVSIGSLKAGQSLSIKYNSWQNNGSNIKYVIQDNANGYKSYDESTYQFGGIKTITVSSEKLRNLPSNNNMAFVLQLNVDRSSKEYSFDDIEIKVISFE